MLYVNREWRMSMWDLCKYNENNALVDEFENYVTYKELFRITQEIGKVIKGDRCLVVSLCKNTIGSIAGYISFINNHVVPIMLNSNMDVELMYGILNTYLPTYIWCPTEEIENYTNFVQFQKVYSVYDYSLLKTEYNNSYSLYKDLCLLLTTSGSTGSPKFVRQSYDNVRENAESIIKYLELEETERPITTLPLNYTYGLSIVNSHIMVGATLLVTEKSLMQKEFWNFFKEQKATSFGGVPYTYEILNRLRFYNMNLPSLRYFTQAGGKLSFELHKKFAEYAKNNKKKFVVMYGQCEATARMGYLPAEKALEKCGSMGIAIPGGNFYLIDINGNEIKNPHVAGELVYTGANVTLGYAENGKDLIKADERNGVLHTGDMAQFDEDGYFYIVGRKKRFLKIYGNRVNLDEIDQLIKAKFPMIECTSAGIDDCMYIFVTDESKTEEIRAFVVQKTGLNAAAFKTIVIDEIPKNDAGKTLYKELTKYYE